MVEAESWITLGAALCLPLAGLEMRGNIIRMRILSKIEIKCVLLSEAQYRRQHSAL